MSLFLNANTIFSQAPPAALETLLEASSIHQYRRGETILSADEPARHIFALERGSVRVFHTSADGGEVLVKILRAPAIFGEAEAFSGLPYRENVAALEFSEILSMPIEAVQVLLSRSPDCAIALIADICARFSIAIDNQKSLMFDQVRVRLANFLVDFALAMPRLGAQQGWMVRLTQDEMAAALGVTRRAIAKEIIAWQKQGILERTRAGYHIRDLNALCRSGSLERLGLAYTLGDEVRFMDQRVKSVTNG